jgi:DNA polymerase-3 subunit gamma/tau
MAGDADDGQVQPATVRSATVQNAPLALYRRYRPATFAELKGQDHVTEPLRQALRSGRVHHAYLFSGPRGCGKTSSARILARSLNCENGPTPDPCGKCASCVALAPSGPGSIDVIEIDAASHGGIDDARDLRERAFYSPVSARFKIYIIDEAHMVTGAGFNALLKLVEEPPPHLKFVFATTEPEKVIPTIRSRTHHYPFRLMPPAVLRELLEEILSAEKIDFEPALLPVVIRAGAGSARDTLSILDQLMAGADDGGLRYDRAIALLGYTDDALLDEMAEAFAAGDGALVFRAIDHVVEAGHDPRRFAMDLLDRLRDLIVLAMVPDAGSSGLLDLPADRLALMAEQAGKFGQERLVRAAETVSSGLVEMRGATSPRLLLELMCAQVLLPVAGRGSAPGGGAPGSNGQSGGDLDARIKRLERQLAAALDRLAAGQAVPAESRQVAGASPAQGRGSMVAEPPRRQAREQTRTEQQPASQPRRQAEPAPAGGGGQSGDRDQSGGGGQSGDRDQSGAAGQSWTDGAATGFGAAELLGRWDEVLGAVRAVRKVAWILLSHAAVESLDGGVLTLAFDGEGNAKGFGTSGCDQDLAEVLERMFGVRPVIRASVQTGAPTSRGGVQPAGDSRPAGPESGRQIKADGPPPDGPLPDGARRDGARRDGARQDGARRDGALRDSARPDGPPASTRSDGARSDGARSDGARSEPGKAAGRKPASPADGPARTPRPGAGTAAAMSAADDDDPRWLTDPGAAGAAPEVTGTDLIMRELGGRIIEETDED